MFLLLYYLFGLFLVIYPFFFFSRKEIKVLKEKIEKLKAVKLECSRQKTELKLTYHALERERAKSAQLSKDIKKRNM